MLRSAETLPTLALHIARMVTVVVAELCLGRNELTRKESQPGKEHNQIANNADIIIETIHILCGSKLESFFPFKIHYFMHYLARLREKIMTHTILYYILPWHSNILSLAINDHLV